MSNTDELDGHPVKVHIYDLSKGMARSLSKAFLGKQIDGVWHTGIVVFGQEYYFGGMGGIEACPPGGTILGQPDEIGNLGNTQIPFDVFMNYLSELAQTSFRPSTYHLLHHNCNNFSSELAQFLTGNDIPSQITNLPSDVLSTPFGQMIKPWVDAMSIQPSGGHAVFPSTSPPETGTPSDGASNSSPIPDFESLSPESDEEEQDNKPILITESLPNQKDFREDLISKLSTKDLSYINDIFDYISLKDKTMWSLGREHVQAIHVIIGDGRMGDLARTGIMAMLQKLVLEEDFIVLLQHDPTQLVLKIIEHFEQLTDGVQVSIVKMITNLSSTEKGHKMLTNTDTSSSESSMLTLTSKLCVNCLLSEKTALNQSSSALAYNLSIYQISEDTQVELGSAILECLQKDSNEQTVYQLMKCLVRLMDSNTEVCDLASVVGMNCGQNSKTSPRIGQLCDKAQQLSSL